MLSAAGLIDRWIDDTGLGWLLAVGVGGGIGSVAWTALILPLRTQLTDVQLAQQVERRYPGLAGCVSAAMSFRAQCCAESQGSTVLQTAVIEQAVVDLRGVDPREIVDPKKIRPAGPTQGWRRVAWRPSSYGPVHSKPRRLCVDSPVRGVIFPGPASISLPNRPTRWHSLGDGSRRSIADCGAERRLNLMWKISAGTSRRKSGWKTDSMNSRHPCERLPKQTRPLANGKSREVAALQWPAAARPLTVSGRWW